MKDFNIVEYNIPPQGGDPDMDIVYKLTGMPDDVAKAKFALREKCDAMAAESRRKKQRGQQIDKYWTAVDPNKWRKTRYIYEFEAKDINGNMVNFEKYRGQPLLIVNVASRCGGTDRNYKQLTALYQKYAEKGLKILAFPCNQFHNQEPYIERDIKEFVTTRYGVNFDMFSRIHVLGPDTHPLYNWLVNTTHGTLGDIIKWNFTKFIVDKKGRAVQRYGPNVDPEKIEPDIPKYLLQLTKCDGFGPHGLRTDLHHDQPT
uniref:Glutathione peroxidase n=1 Tax=Branchiostoma belcheri tsingtauense TaxID=155462 RepID=B3UZR4_BRABE|nr:phospholipid-hydroperoxide glutathione peroxidase [Branchiostoma belcheri tsingtauense]